MDWEFFERPTAGDGYAAAQSRIIIEGDHSITPFEVFIREVLQNSLDASRDAQKVTVRFRVRTINQPGQRGLFLEGVGWSKLKERVAAANRVRNARLEPPEFGDPSNLEAHPLRVLEITESGTIGLVGPETVRTESDERYLPGGTPKAYLALTREDARREKQGLGSGGTYGLGKAVLWAASSVQTVVFFSRLSAPENGTTHRLAAQARLGPHFLNNQPYRGLGYGGDRRDGWCRPIRDEPARALASKLGVDPRIAETDSGTTIIIPFWTPPESDQSNLQEHALIARYAARYFWPAVVDDRLEVIAVSNEGNEISAADNLGHYEPFIQLYQRVKNGVRGPNDVPAENLDFTVPKGPPPRTEGPTQTYARVAMTFVSEAEVREDFNRKVACIRGQGMVVGYAKMTGNTLVRPFVGLALGGRAADSTMNGVRGDVLLGFSEYVTHTRWDEKSNSLRHWPQARPVVRDILTRMRDYFLKHSREETPEPSNDLGPIEDGLKFPGLGGTGPPPPPPHGVPKLHTHEFVRQGDRFRFEVRARVEADSPPFHVDLWIDPGMETGTASRADRFTLENLTTVPVGLVCSPLPNGKWRVQVPALGSATQVRIKGATVRADPALLAVSEGWLRASLNDEETTTARTEPVGEE